MIALFSITLSGIPRLGGRVLGHGRCTGAALNYSLVHPLHLTFPSIHFITTSLLTTFRGFGASFGSAIGGGIFARALTDSFTSLRDSHNLPPDDRLLEQILGSPATVGLLTGVDKEIAISSYESALMRLFLVGGAVSVAAVALQAGTGWTAPKEADETDER